MSSSRAAAERTDAADAATADRSDKPRHRLPAVGLILLFGSFALLPLSVDIGLDPFFLVVATRIMILAIAALSLDFILGYGGLVSFGHAAFLGIGAYAVGIASSHGAGDLLIQIPIAIAASALFALITGAISLRTRGVYFIMITLAFGQMAYFLMVSLSAYGGDDGLTLAARSTVFGQPWLENDVAFYYLVFGFLLGTYLLARTFIHARFGRVLRGTRDNALRMNAIGFTPFNFRLTAYVIAGVMAGIAGTLLANQAEFVSPAYMTWQRSGELIMMVVVGGMGTLTGGVVGAVVFMLLEETLSEFSQHWKLALGIILIVIVLFGRGGVLGMLQKLARGRSRS
ncbi:MAG: branched-chain amino acid ABC transporter permease [Geminicoccaceae bacterium]